MQKVLFGRQKIALKIRPLDHEKSYDLGFIL